MAWVETTTATKNYFFFWSSDIYLSDFPTTPKNSPYHRSLDI